MTHRTSAYPLCRHTKTDGCRCQSPALTTSAFCHHHQRLRRTRRTTITVAPTTSAVVFFKLPPIDSLLAIQRALSDVLIAIGDGRLDHSQARLMLKTLRMASSNARRNLRESGS